MHYLQIWSPNLVPFTTAHQVDPLLVEISTVMSVAFYNPEENQH